MHVFSLLKNILFPYDNNCMLAKEQEQNYIHT